MGFEDIFSPSSSSRSSNPKWTHDVFLSFAGDTRNRFTSHLRAALDGKGVKVYRDDRNLERGKEIEPSLMDAIHNSRFSIVIFSKRFASSRWCLDEVAEIVRWVTEKQHIAWPVFYQVRPSEVANQRGVYGRAFDKHETNEDREKVKRWRDALSKMATISGWDVGNRDEAELVKEIVGKMRSEVVGHPFSSIHRDLVGMDSLVKVIEHCMHMGEDSCHGNFIGICGMGGLGKTSIARAVYYRNSWNFEGSCYLAKVRDVFEKHGPLALQEELLSQIFSYRKNNVWDPACGREEIERTLKHKKVLVVLDDVDKPKQLEMLAAEPSWFGSGSQIIITSRDKQILVEHGVANVYLPLELEDGDAMQLFCKKAFKQDQPMNGYHEIAKRIVDYTEGLPLALEVFGSGLYGKSIAEWAYALDRIEELDEDVLKELEISYNGLRKSEKEMFLDIACFFNGTKMDEVTRILNSCDLRPDIGIKALIDKFLVLVSHDHVWMHNLLQRLGRYIICKESVGRRSRLWCYEDVDHVLGHNQGGEEVERIVLDLPEIKKTHWNMEAFSRMNKLKVLILHNVQVFQGPESLPNELRFLQWHHYPATSLPPSFQPDKLVELDLSYSNIQVLWKGIKNLGCLKTLNLSYSRKLSATPDFTGVPNLEKLILKGCTALVSIHPSVQGLKKLTHFTMQGTFLGNILLGNLDAFPQSLRSYVLVFNFIANAKKNREVTI